MSENAAGADVSSTRLLEQLKLKLIERSVNLQQRANEFATDTEHHKLLRIYAFTINEVVGAISETLCSNKTGERICEPSAGSKYAPADGSDTRGG